ncbi:MAG: MCE family protein [Deltaproteobacteria bacterium]|nr:MCE family protein [Deltaproteobacteria bacterium]
MAVAREVKVGAFVAVGLAVAGLIVFLIGDERRAFEKKQRYVAVFDDVQGLARGSPIRMGGVDVGQVASVGYADDPADSRLYVTLDVVRSEARRVRTDSVVTIAAKGLLGDKMVVISVGSPEQPELPPGSTVASKPPTDLAAMAERFVAIGEKAEAVVANLEKTTATLADEGVREDLKVAVRSMSRILKNVDEGDGYIARLLRDPAEADRMSRIMAHLEHASLELDRTLGGVSAIVARVGQGPGSAHELLFGEGAARAVDELGRASGELAKVLEGVRTGNGLAKSVLFGDDETQKLVGDLQAIVKNARDITDGVRAGRGTVGALLVDPSVYEDLKLLLGNVERNKALRALVRYSIQRDEKVPPVEIRDPAPAPAGAAAAPGVGVSTRATVAPGD